MLVVARVMARVRRMIVFNGGKMEEMTNSDQEDRLVLENRSWMSKEVNDRMLRSCKITERKTYMKLTTCFWRGGREEW